MTYDAKQRLKILTFQESHGMAAACDKAELVPKPIGYILSDNGSEFMKDFETELKQRRTTHWWTYPKSPKMNAHVERFNRSLQESFTDNRAALCERLLFIDVASVLIGNWRNGRCFTTPNAPSFTGVAISRYNRS